MFVNGRSALESALSASYSTTAPLRTRRLFSPILGPGGVATGEGRTGCTLASLTHSQLAASKLRSIDTLNCARRGIRVAELDKRKPTRLIGCPVHRQDDLNDLTDGGK